MINWEAYERRWERRRGPGIVFFRPAVARTPLVEDDRAHGYRRTDVGPFVVFAAAYMISNVS